MYQRILVPIENESQQEPALDHARLLARATGATILLVWLVPVVASEEHFFREMQVEPGSSGERRKAQGEAFLAQAAEALRGAGVKVVTKMVVTPEPLEQTIVAQALEERANLIILATLPQSAVGRFLFGSVGDKVRRRSPIPVLFVNPSQAAEGSE